MHEEALSGIRAIDFGQYIAGPLAAMLLAEQGADVVKVERTMGDPARKEDGFLVWNRSKKSIVLDLKKTEGLKIARDLVKNADVVIENYRPGVMDRLGLGYEAVKAINPRIIYCSISGFGPTGPYSTIPGYEQIVSSISSIYTEQGAITHPLYIVLPLASTYTAAEAAYDVVAALCMRETSGKGQKIDLSIFRTILSTFRQYLVDFEGIIRSYWTPTGPLPLYRAYAGSDGKYFFLGCGNYKFVTLFCIVMEHEEWLEDPILDGAPFLILPPNSSRLRARLTNIFKTRTRDEWLELLSSNGIPVAPVQTIEEFMKYEQIRAVDMIQSIEQPGKGTVTEMGIPVALGLTPGTIKGPAPKAGQHSKEILRKLGYRVADIARLKRESVIK
jgi:crotonobetainyl-CoA:carnitine CoA-transferase CaiB-like acyl-CoA transferase